MLGSLAFNRLGIGGKLTLAFTALAGLTLLVVALGFVADRKATRNINLTTEVRGPASLILTKAQASLLQIQLHVRGYLVLSDPLDIAQYELHKKSFESHLATLQAMPAAWGDGEDAQRVAMLTQIYTRWVELPRQLFELHDNPLKNRPALRLARIEVKPRQVRIMDDIDGMIGLEKVRVASANHRERLAAMTSFQTSYDAMVTNLQAYAASGELNFKLAYGPQLATNATIWNDLWGQRAQLSTPEWRLLDSIAANRAEIAALALNIVAILNGEHAYEDLYLYRTEVAPQAEVMLRLLGEVTTHQQALLQADLARARDSLADAHLMTVSGGLLVVGLSVLMALVLRQKIVGPVWRLTVAAERVAAGDLSARAEVESGDEIGLLATTINTMTQRLADTIGHLETVFSESQRAKDAAEVANRAKSAFLASMSHELRTPLNAVLGYAQILQRDKRLDEQQSARLNVILKSGQHLLMLINDILDVSRIEAGKLELYPEAVNLRRFLSEIADIIRVKTEEKSLSFVFDAAPDLPGTVQADDKRLRQALLNLLGNAVKFTDRGEVTFRVRQLAREHEQVCLRFEVEDTGVGIAARELESIFQRFEQVGDVQRRIGGTGLGLAISRELTHMMNSEIKVESRVGHGSRFWFDLVLPVIQSGEESTPLTRVIAGYRGPRKKVLVIDDVDANRALIVDLLSALGFDLTEATNGQQGLDQAQRTAPDLILMDIVMPVMDGLEATRRLRQLSAFKDVPIIAASASASAADQQNSLAVGATAFLPKPLDFSVLLEKISSLLTLHWLFAGSDDAPPAEGETAALLVPPPADELAVLHNLAMAGNMRDIQDWAAQLATRGQQYRPFADKLRRMAASYQSKAILGLVNRYRDETVP